MSAIVAQCRTDLPTRSSCADWCTPAARRHAHLKSLSSASAVIIPRACRAFFAGYSNRGSSGVAGGDDRLVARGLKSAHCAHPAQTATEPAEATSLVADGFANN